MGKHSSPAADARGANDDPGAAVPAVLAQTAVLGLAAVVITVLALLWAGVEGRVAAACGVGLLAVGTVTFLLLRRTGLVADPVAEERDGAAEGPAHP